MKTFMEQHSVINKCKNGELPLEMTTKLPEISALILKMMNPDPSSRPTLSNITNIIVSQQFRCPDLTGEIEQKREDSSQWVQKYFKVVGRRLMIFRKKEESKAEQIYELDDWIINIRDGTAIVERNCSTSVTASQNLDSYIELENALQLGLLLRRESVDLTKDLYEKIKNAS